MPYVRKSFRRKPRARPMRRRAVVKRRMPVRRVPRLRGLTSGFPEVKVVTLKYCAQHMLPSTPLSVTGSHNYRTNSVYDPDYTSGGHQPYAFDTWSALYGHYEVVSSQINVKFVTSQGFQNAMCSVVLVNDVDSSTDLTLVRERPGTYCKLVTANQPVTITRKWAFRKDSPNHAGWDNTATVAANPNDSDFFRIFVSNVDGTTPLSQYSVAALVEIRYVVKFWERANLGLS